MARSAPASENVVRALRGLAVLASLGVAQASAQTVSVSCGNAILMDAETHSVLFEKEADALEFAGLDSRRS